MYLISRTQFTHISADIWADSGSQNVPPEPTFRMGNPQILGLLCTIGGNTTKWQLASIYKGNQRFLKLQFLYFIGMDWLWIEYQNWQFSLGIDNPGGNFYIWTKKFCRKPLKNTKTLTSVKLHPISSTWFSHISTHIWADSGSQNAPHVHTRAHILNGQPTISGVTLHNRWKCCKVAISLHLQGQPTIS